MSAFLLDANVLIALTVAEHEHHDRASAWLAGVDEFALCPMVEGAFSRFLLRMGEPPQTAITLLAAVKAHPKARFWPDDVSYAGIDYDGVRGHRQVTDVYLADLAARHSGALATLDEGLPALRPTRTRLVPAPAPQGPGT